MNKRILIFIGLAIAGSIIFALYTFLGGFKEIIINKQTVSKPQTLAYIPYQGYVRHHRLDSLFDLIQQLHTQGKLKGTLGAIYYDVSLEKRKKGDTKALVGVWISDTLAVLPPGFRLHTIPARQVIQAKLQAHFLVSPSPDEVQDKMREYAKKQGLKVENFIIEKYLSDDSIILEMPIR
ncbi:MAG: hypothetical protein V4714_11360 [Bacteroidota bacterium]